MKRVLLLGSQSQSRQQLLRDAGIPFTVVGHSADETRCDLAEFSFMQLVEQIAIDKMENVNMPAGAQGGDVRFILTADTLCITKDGDIQGKPTGRADAIEKIKAAREGARVGTAFCLDKRAYKFKQWRVVKRVRQFVQTDYVFDIPDEWIDTYLEKSIALSASGAIAIESFGTQFLKDVHGSYSTIVGLPMFELRQALEEIGFFAWVAQ